MRLWPEKKTLDESRGPVASSSLGADEASGEGCPEGVLDGEGEGEGAA